MVIDTLTLTILTDIDTHGHMHIHIHVQRASLTSLINDNGITRLEVNNAAIIDRNEVESYVHVYVYVAAIAAFLVRLYVDVATLAIYHTVFF